MAEIYGKMMRMSCGIAIQGRKWKESRRGGEKERGMQKETCERERQRKTVETEGMAGGCETHMQMRKQKLKESMIVSLSTVSPTQERRNVTHMAALSTRLQNTLRARLYTDETM